MVSCGEYSSGKSVGYFTVPGLSKVIFPAFPISTDVLIRRVDGLSRVIFPMLSMGFFRWGARSSNVKRLQFPMPPFKDSEISLLSVVFTERKSPRTGLMWSFNWKNSYVELIVVQLHCRSP